MSRVLQTRKSVALRQPALVQAFRHPAHPAHPAHLPRLPRPTRAQRWDDYAVDMIDNVMGALDVLQPRPFSMREACCSNFESAFLPGRARARCSKWWFVCRHGQGRESAAVPAAERQNRRAAAADGQRPTAAAPHQLRPLRRGQGGAFNAHAHAAHLERQVAVVATRDARLLPRRLRPPRRQHVHALGVRPLARGGRGQRRPRDLLPPLRTRHAPHPSSPFPLQSNACASTEHHVCSLHGTTPAA